MQLRSEAKAADESKGRSNALAALGRKARTSTDPGERAANEREMGVQASAFERFLIGLERAFARKPDPDELREQADAGRELQQSLRRLGPGAAAVYTLVAPDRCFVLLFTEDLQLARESRIASEELGARVKLLRQALSAPSGRPEIPAGQIYKLLLEPFHKQLAAARTRILLWSLDGPLRYVPVAALYDGRGYLVRSFSNVVLTPTAMPATLELPRSKWTGLAMGVSKPYTVRNLSFAALPHVSSELNAVVGGALPGKIKLNDDFTWAGAADELASHAYSVVHIASHFEFHAGSEEESFLLLGDGSQMSLAALRRQPNLFRGVDLLTLSACNTAMSGTGADGVEIDGLATVAKEQGANAVLATLWAVADESTSLLMGEFYRQREADPGISKAEALRRAQLRLMGATALGGDNRRAASGRRSARPLNSSSPAHATVGYDHPYFWAPFILIGSWN
jgi:CHAT domain-containing protein